jgi:hypothetical protein
VEKENLANFLYTSKAAFKHMQIYPSKWWSYATPPVVKKFLSSSVFMLASQVLSVILWAYNNLLPIVSLLVDILDGWGLMESLEGAFLWMWGKQT